MVNVAVKAARAAGALINRAALDIEGEGGAHVHSTGAPQITRRFMLAAAAILLILYLLSGVYIVRPGEAAVVRRFGTVTAGNTGPGLHYRWPWPVDRVDIVAVDAVRRVHPGRPAVSFDAALQLSSNAYQVRDSH